MSNTPAATISIPKPVLKGLHNATIKKNLIVSMVLVFATGIAYKFIINEPKKQRYAEFYKTYDANKEFEEMKAAGVFQSC